MVVSYRPNVLHTNAPEGRETGEGYVAFYATPTPFLLNKICLNQGR